MAKLSINAACLLLILATKGLEAHASASLSELNRSSSENPLDCMNAFMASTREQVFKWPFNSAASNATDRVAATNFAPSDQKEVDAFAWKVRWMSRVLGSSWAIQIFYATDEGKNALDAMLGHPPNVIWSQLRMNGKVVHTMTKAEFNKQFVTNDHWDALQHEHILWFELDAMLIQTPQCLEPFLKYDYVGAPWRVRPGFPEYGGNGGLSLQRRSAVLNALTAPYNRHGEPADIHLVHILHKSGASFPSRDESMRFSSEEVNYPNPCGYHCPARFAYQRPTSLVQGWCDIARKTFEQVNSDLGQLPMKPRPSPMKDVAAKATSWKHAIFAELHFSSSCVFIVSLWLLGVAATQILRGKGFLAFVTVIAYLTALPLVQISMKSALHELPYPVSIGMVHKFCTIGVAMLWERPQLKFARPAMPVSLLAGVVIACNNMALLKGSVAVVGIIGTCTPAVTYAIKPSRDQELLPVLLAILGAMLCVTGELHFSVACVHFASLSTCFKGLRNTMMYKVTATGMSAVQMTFWNCFWAAVAYVPMLFFVEGTNFIRSFEIASHETKTALMFSACCAVRAFLS
eukprot:TRINITY_DN7127_c0_g2_i1.p1 TRINITY_DN7127_c0_g2~~TRINITY_DN7127_c0_g2_i1.p1  ORF type:complete len:574 (-),score=49.68 TRINITY_DN7127_c0_g2_i1:328-2049(-)